MHDITRGSPVLDRRRAIQVALGLAGAAMLAGTGARAQEKVSTNAKIVIAGAGAAGLTMANRLSALLDGASITLVDARREHYYQPGFTLVGAGVKPVTYPVSTTQEYVPRGAGLIAEAVAEIDPEARVVVTETGQRIDYDFLIIATGLTLDYAAIEGMDTALIGTNGIGSVYAGPEAAHATYREMARFAETGGTGVFGRPATEMKCAGAPLKYTFLTEDALTRAGTRDRARLIYTAQNQTLFGVPIVSEKVRMLFGERGIDVAYDHVLKAIDPVTKRLTYTTPEGDVQLEYDFTHVVPPQRAPEVIRNSPLPWQDGPFAADGWVEVDKASLRHLRYPEVFAVGDVAGVPKGKTAASVKWQAPVAAAHIACEIAGEPCNEAYTGYTSCPLITRIGRAMLIEFDYDNNLVQSFPGVIAPLEELWISWIMKEIALKPTYVAMLRGDA
jgi:sulfide:quinone oxidoreductase